ncbi:hypothetical protein SCAR479_02308 [Seiridium cardinale]|uniref:Uncharacterized protein n=1 Tax=Seiridium cardinale TaxID=138064 RepID=A0ABR2X5N1_9PEZI
MASFVASVSEKSHENLVLPGSPSQNSNTGRLLLQSSYQMTIDNYEPKNDRLETLGHGNDSGHLVRLISTGVPIAVRRCAIAVKAFAVPVLNQRVSASGGCLNCTDTSVYKYFRGIERQKRHEEYT